MCVCIYIYIYTVYPQPALSSWIYYIIIYHDISFEWYTIVYYVIAYYYIIPSCEYAGMFMPKGRNCKMSGPAKELRNRLHVKLWVRSMVFFVCLIRCPCSDALPVGRNCNIHVRVLLSFEKRTMFQQNTQP